MRILHAAECPESDLIDAAVACVRAGGTIIFPTETVYGIGAAAENDEGVAAVYAAKGRSSDKPLALHVANTKQTEPFVAAWTEAAQRAIAQFWPGPLALVLKRQPHRFEKAAAGYATISLRCPDHALARRILEQTGPLAATSANHSGHAAFTGSVESIADLPAASLAIIAGQTALRRESTIMDCSSEVPRILRRGAIDEAALMRVVGTLETNS